MYTYLFDGFERSTAHQGSWVTEKTKGSSMQREKDTQKKRKWIHEYSKK